jgi:hypothetical protein
MSEEQMQKLFAALLGMSNSSSVPEEMEQYVNQLEAAMNSFSELAFRAGVTAVALNSTGEVVSKFGGDAAYEEKFPWAGSYLSNLCPGTFTAVKFAPDTDNDVAPEQILVRATMVREAVPDIYQGIFGAGNSRDKQYDFDVMVLEYMRVKTVFPSPVTEAAPHAHFDAEVLVTQKVTREQFLSGQIKVPALPTTVLADSMEFWESLEFMDENPPSGG